MTRSERSSSKLGSAHFPKTSRVEARLRDPAIAGLSWEALAPRLVDALRDHELPPDGLVEDPPPGAMFPKFLARRLQAMCIHTPTYGTVSSTLLALTPGGVARYLYAAGHPCEAPFVDVRGALG